MSARGGRADRRPLAPWAPSKLYEQAIRTLDDKRRVELGQQIDQALWNLMPQVPLYQITGAYAVRSTLANFGSPGFADVIYEDIGYTK